MDQHFITTYFSPLYTFCYGFGLCCVFLLMAHFAHWKTKGEFRRYKNHLSDKLLLDSKQLQDTNKERTRLAQENEHLRLQVARLNERADNKMHRELEIFARAEKQMLINAPGFAPAWEMAKANALSQLQSEESGSSFPHKIFRKLLGSGASGTPGSTTTTIPAEAAKTGSSATVDAPTAA